MHLITLQVEKTFVKNIIKLPMFIAIASVIRIKLAAHNEN